MRRLGSHRDDHDGHAARDATGAQIIPLRRRSNSGVPGNSDDATSARQAILDEERVRMRQNLAVAVVLVVLMCAGGWLVANLRASSRMEALHRGWP